MKTAWRVRVTDDDAMLIEIEAKSDAGLTLLGMSPRCGLLVA